MLIVYFKKEGLVVKSVHLLPCTLNTCIYIFIDYNTQVECTYLLGYCM